MQLLGTLKDATTGQYLPGATIEVLNFEGKPTGKSVAANNMGSFVLDVVDNAKLLVTHVGYKPTLVDANYFDPGNILEMDRAATELEGVTVTVKKKTKSNNWIIYVIGAAVVTKILKLW